MRRDASFAQGVKDELCAVPVRGRTLDAELHGLFRAAGSLLVGLAGLGCEIRAGRAVVVRRAYRLLRAVGERPTLAVRRSAGPGNRFVCRVAAAGPLLQRIGLVDRRGRPRPGIPSPLRRPAVAAALLRGFFLGSGSVDDPRRDHHLEFEVGEAWPPVLDGLVAALAGCGLPGHRSRRRGRAVVYLKDGAAIAEALAAMGAGNSYLAYEEQRIRRQLRGEVNRVVNAEAANLDKAAAAGVAQAAALEWLAARGRLDGLSPGLRAVADVRLRHPEASLRELGVMLNPPLSKSGVQHRLRVLSRLVPSGGFGGIQEGGSRQTN